MIDIVLFFGIFLAVSERNLRVQLGSQVHAQEVNQQLEIRETGRAGRKHCPSKQCKRRGGRGRREGS